MTATVTQIKEPAKRPWQEIQHDPLTIKKVKKSLGVPAVDELTALDEDQLRGYIVALANHEEATRAAQKRNPDIIRLKEQLRNSCAPYRETLRGIAERRTLATHLLDERLA